MIKITCMNYMRSEKKGVMVFCINFLAGGGVKIQGVALKLYFIQIKMAKYKLGHFSRIYSSN